MSKDQQVKYSLREEAANRAANAAMLSSSSSFTNNQNMSTTKNSNDQQPQQQRQVAGLPTSQNPHSRTKTIITDNNEKDRFDVTETAALARQQWRQHGEHTSQILEDRRQALLQPNINVNITQSSSHSKHAQSNSVSTIHPSFPYPNNSPRFSVRVITTEERIDPAGAGYTVYILEVESLSTTPPKSNDSYLYNHKELQQYSHHRFLKKQRVARRYSDFSRLYILLKRYHVPFRSAFPSKSLAGRLGNWTPAIQFAPSARHDLITFRKIQLDIWLVELAELLGSDEIPKEIQSHAIDFLTREEEVAPCHHQDVIIPSSHNVNPGKHYRNKITDASLSSNLVPPVEENNGIAASINHHFHINLSNPLSFTMGSEIRKAISTIQSMTQAPHANPSSTSSSDSQFIHTISDQSIPLDLLHQAWGLCFLTVIKAGLIFSGRVGTGLMIARSSDGGWSAPCAIGTVGMGWGMLMGGDITNYLIILNTKKAVKAFASNSVNLGAEIGIAVGPVGRGGTGNLNAGIGEKTLVSAYSYAHSKGLFVGLSLEGSVVKVRGDVNAKFYGRRVEADEILFGNLGERPRAAKGLYDALDEAMGKIIDGWRPSDALLGFRNKHPEFLFNDKNRSNK